MLMDLNKIEELLNKYWNAETSLEEEEQLRTYFNGRNIPEQFNEAAALFRYFSANKKKELSDVSFNKTVLSKVKAGGKGKMRSLVFNSLRIAAGISVLVVAFWFVHQEVRQSDPQEIEDTYNDPKLAFEETKKALRMISRSFGNAEQQARKINLFNQAQEEIQKEPEQKENL